MAHIFPTALPLPQIATEEVRNIHAEIMKIQKVKLMSAADQIRLAENIYQGKLRLHENGMLDATPHTTDSMAMWVVSFQTSCYLLTYARTYQKGATSLLLRLPAEVRNKIFAYVCNGLDIFMKIMNGGEGPVYIMDGNFPHSARIFSPFVALQQTCRQVYIKTALLPFSAANKYFYYTSGLDRCYDLLYIVQLQCIRHVSFFVTVDDVGSPGLRFGDLYLLRLQGLQTFPHLQEITVYINTVIKQPENLLEGLKTAMRDELEKLVSADVKVVCELRRRELDFVCWPRPGH
jgi:hypothetical protein